MKVLNHILSIPLLLVSWTGWTKEDYISFFKKFSPWNTGWSKDEWIGALQSAGCFLAAAILWIIVGTIYHE